MKRILFVDDEPKVLEGLKRMLYAYRQDWDMVFVSNGHEALQKLADSSFDVLVTDVRMPQMNGVQLLTEIRERYPHVVRIVLSGQADREITLPTVALAHQYLAKPCNAQIVRETVDRAVNLHLLLEDPGLKQVVSRIHSLPSIPAVYTQLMKAIESDTSPKEIGKIVAKDLAMTAKILQLVNSSVFGVQRRITNPAEAVIFLGTETVRALALTVSVFSQFHTNCVPDFSLEHLRDHSMAVGALARRIAKSMQLSKSETDDAFLGGLLHEVGKLVLAANYPQDYESAILRARQQSIPMRNAEREVFGTTHSQVGAYLLWLWGMPTGVTEIISHYDDLGSPPTPSVAAVHLANALVTEEFGESIDLDGLSQMGFADRLPEWKQIGEEVRQGVGA